jgi:hypothetical protein
MARYFFDVRDGDRVIADPDGLEFADLAAVREEAATALAEMARDSLPTTTRRRMSIDVRTDADVPILRASLSFDVEDLSGGEPLT